MKKAKVQKAQQKMPHKKLGLKVQKAQLKMPHKKLGIKVQKAQLKMGANGTTKMSPQKDKGAKGTTKNAPQKAGDKGAKGTTENSPQKLRIKAQKDAHIKYMAQLHKKRTTPEMLELTTCILLLVYQKAIL